MGNDGLSSDDFGGPVLAAEQREAEQSLAAFKQQVEQWEPAAKAILGRLQPEKIKETWHDLRSFLRLAYRDACSILSMAEVEALGSGGGVSVTLENARSLKILRELGID